MHQMIQWRLNLYCFYDNKTINKTFYQYLHFNVYYVVDLVIWYLAYNFMVGFMISSIFLEFSGLHRQ